jgi:hypothetical protein
MEKPHFSLKDRYLVTKRMFQLATGEIADAFKDARFPIGMKSGENLLSYLDRRGTSRIQANEANLSSYILEKKIGSIAWRRQIEDDFVIDLLTPRGDNND